MQEPDVAVSLTDVRRTYQVGEPVHALDGVTLAVPRGSYTAVMGPSGSGKSTLLNLVGCLDTPTAGTVTVGGQETGGLRERELARIRGEEVGFVFQTFNLMPRLTALENVALPLVFQGVGAAERSERAEETLERVGLGDRLDHRPNELSGGQRQRVAIGRALVSDPSILLADEPTGNLDTDTGARIMALFDELHDAGNTILMVTHERHIAEHADRVVHLLDGEIERTEELPDAGAAGDRPTPEEGAGSAVDDGPAGQAAGEEGADRGATEDGVGESDTGDVAGESRAEDAPGGSDEGTPDESGGERA